MSASQLPLSPSAMVSPGALHHIWAPNGRTVAHNFSDWFGASKVVNAAGEPRVLFHGTTRSFDAFKVSDRGSFGAGIYLASCPAQAGEFCPGDGLLMPVYAAIKRPFYTAADYDIGEEHDLDTPAAPLLLSLFGHAGLERMRASGQCDLGREVMDRLIELGHDGIIATYPDDQSAEVIAFRPEQIKSAIGNSGLYSVFSGDLLDSPAPRLGAAAKRKSSIHEC